MGWVGSGSTQSVLLKDLVLLLRVRAFSLGIGGKCCRLGITVVTSQSLTWLGFRLEACSRFRIRGLTTLSLKGLNTRTRSTLKTPRSSTQSLTPRRAKTLLTPRPVNLNNFNPNALKLRLINPQPKSPKIAPRPRTPSLTVRLRPLGPSGFRGVWSLGFRVWCPTPILNPKFNPNTFRRTPYLPPFGAPQAQAYAFRPKS